MVLEYGIWFKNIMGKNKKKEWVGTVLHRPLIMFLYCGSVYTSKSFCNRTRIVYALLTFN
jgi:hypothetical protein